MSELNEEQQDQVLKLFKKYSQVFAKDDYDLGCAREITHNINTGDVSPI